MSVRKPSAYGASASAGQPKRQRLELSDSQLSHEARADVHEQRFLAADTAATSHGSSAPSYQNAPSFQLLSAGQATQNKVNAKLLTTMEHIAEIQVQISEGQVEARQAAHLTTKVLELLLAKIDTITERAAAVAATPKVTRKRSSPKKQQDEEMFVLEIADLAEHLASFAFEISATGSWEFDIALVVGWANH
jgi:hypothetical protein